MLAIKDRPTSFEQIIGQDSAIKALCDYKNKTGRYPPVILLYGAYGCGKTTIANIIAKEIAHTCAIQEVNASDESGVEDMRKLAYKMAQPPLFGEINA